MKRKRQLKSTATVRKFLRMMRAQGCIIIWKPGIIWQGASDDELVERWEAYIRRLRKRSKPPTTTPEN